MVVDEGIDESKLPELIDWLVYNIFFQSPTFS